MMNTKKSVVPQDLGRAILNLFNNAFYAVSEKSKLLNDRYEPTVRVTTRGINGLSLTYDIIKSHGGEIRVNTKESEGTEFVIVLPL